LRKSSRRTGKINYADLVNGIVSHRSKWRVLLDSQKFLPDTFERVSGSDLTLDRLRSTGFHHPVIIKPDSDGTTDGLDMKLPTAALTVDDVRDSVGSDTPVEVIDVATQSELLDWDMGAWADYFKSEPKERVYNVISLEISGTPLGDRIRRPRVVRELDWVENFWPSKLQETEFPKVQLYCLMSVKDSFTDFHIDFAGSSVFYHILSGSKTFFFIEPTPTHLRKYAKWSSSADQSTTFFGDEVGGKCHKVELKQGDTMLIPAGWIHAVYTPSSSIVIGGNFIHSLHIPMQYRVCDIEMNTNVPPKFRFPFFEKLNWFVALGCLERGPKYLSSLSNTELEGLLALTMHLYRRQRRLKHDTHLLKEERHMIRASVPPEASSHDNGGPTGVLRGLNQAVWSVLEHRATGAEKEALIDQLLRLPTEEEERAHEEGEPAEKIKPRIKLRIKLSSTASSTTSGDEDSSLLSPNEQHVPSSISPTSPPKLTFKLPSVMPLTDTERLGQRQRKRSRHSRADVYDTSSELDDDVADPEADQHLTSDEEWNEFESQIDEGFDEAKDNEEDDEIMDAGGLADLGSSDSEYDGGNRSTTKRTDRRRRSRAKVSNKESTVVATLSPQLGVKTSPETLYFDDGGDASAEYRVTAKPGKRQDDAEGEEAVLGLGKRRKITPLQFSKLLTPSIASVPTSQSTATSTTLMATTATMSRKKPASGGTAKDRIRSLLMKRR
ncbi:JmjC domain-containing histone demethylation protein 1, partial [Dissophora globulifera]